MTDLGFWNEAITRGPPLVDSQTGELIKVRVEPRHQGADRGARANMETRRFNMAGAKGRSGTLWYDDAGSLVRAAVITRGETLDYELAA